MIFQNILTTIGQQKKAAAEAGGAALNITHFKIGDSNGQYYEPSEIQTDLVNTKYTANFTGQSQIIISQSSSNEVLYKCFIPADVGGFTIRELGLFDSDNDLILICKLPAQEKFTVAEGLYQPLTLTPKMIFTNPQTQVILTVSSQIIATQNFVSEQISDLIGGHTTDPDAHLEKFEVIEDEIETHKADKFIHGDHLPLFTPLAVPKILVGDEAIGWGLQGSSHLPKMICHRMSGGNSLCSADELTFYGVDFDFGEVKKTISNHYSVSETIQAVMIVICIQKSDSVPVNCLNLMSHHQIIK